MIKRGKPPKENQWSLPGGRIEWGETAKQAALRELHEETGIDAAIIGLVDVVDGLFDATQDAPARHYVLIDYVAEWISGEPRPGDDARDARFFSRAEIDALGLWSETIRIIDEARQMARAAAELAGAMK